MNGFIHRTVGDFFRAGAFAVGAGGALFDRMRLATKDYAGMTEIAIERRTVDDERKTLLDVLAGAKWGEDDKPVSMGVRSPYG